LIRKEDVLERERERERLDNYFNKLQEVSYN